MGRNVSLHYKNMNIPKHIYTFSLLFILNNKKIMNYLSVVVKMCGAVYEKINSENRELYSSSNSYKWLPILSIIFSIPQTFD